MTTMRMKTTRAMVGAVLGMSLVTVAVLAQPAEPGRPQNQFQGRVKVFILAGQSNMEGHGGVRTLDRLGEHPTHGYLLKKIKRDDGSFVVRDDVFVSYQKAEERLTRPLSVGLGAWGADWFGPELMFGIEMGDFYKEPVLLIKTCWGGHSLYGNFRPPSAGKAAYETGYKPEEIGASYHKMVNEVRECLAQLDTDFPPLKGLTPEICGFVWFQGWNDMCQPGDAIRQQVYDEYCPNFVHLVQDLRAEFKVPNLPVVMGELGVGGEQVDKNMMDFRAAQAKIATIPELKGTLGYVRTAPFWYPELDALPRTMEAEEHRVRKAVAAELREQLKDQPESADAEKLERRVKEAGDEALEKDAAYQKAKRESDSHVCNWYCHYQGSARVYCMVGYSLAEAMKPLLTAQPVKVFILLGQSNMVGLGRIKGGEGSLEHAVRERKKYPYLVDEAGNWSERNDVRFVRYMQGRGLLNNEWMTVAKCGTIGPEFGIARLVGDAMDAPVMILKSCIGNRSLGWDLLPPGSERYKFVVKDRAGVETTMVYAGYKDRPDSWPIDPAKGTATEPPPWLDRNGKPIEWYAGKQWDDDIRDAKTALSDLGKHYPGARGYEVAGFFFWQGEKDAGNPGHAARYEENLVRFIKAVRQEFNAPNAPFVLGTIGESVKGSGGNGGTVLAGQLAVDGHSGKYPEFQGNVATIYTHPMAQGGSGNGHYGGNAEVYMDVGEAMGSAMVELLKAKQ